jgi:hypothetical protein
VVRRKNFAFLAAALTAIAAALVLVAPPSQAHPIYRRAFGNVHANKCLWAPASSTGTNYLDACSKSPNTRAKWNLHVVDSNWRGSGHELWVLESVYYPGKCLYLNRLGISGLGTCNWTSGQNYNTFERFFEAVIDGETAYQLKNTTSWDEGHEACLAGAADRSDLWDSPCNRPPLTTWKVSVAN